MTILEIRRTNERESRREYSFNFEVDKEAVLFFYYSLRLQQLDICARLVAGGVPIVSSFYYTPPSYNDVVVVIVAAEEENATRQ